MQLHQHFVHNRCPVVQLSCNPAKLCHPPNAHLQFICPTLHSSVLLHFTRRMTHHTSHHSCFTDTPARCSTAHACCHGIPTHCTSNSCRLARPSHPPLFTFAREHESSTRVTMTTHLFRPLNDHSIDFLNTLIQHLTQTLLYSTTCPMLSFNGPFKQIFFQLHA